MNQPKLANYGIHTTEEDLRIHVCVRARKVYAFPPAAAIAAVNARAHADQAGHKTVNTGDIITATGYAIPVDQIDPIYEVAIPRGWLRHDYLAPETWITIHHAMSTSAKGKAAERLVKRLWWEGLLNFIRPLTMQEKSNLHDQIRGIDMQVIMPAVQVKCDFAGGRGTGCSGNLFIQTSECNPYRQY